IRSPPCSPLFPYTTLFRSRDMPTNVLAFPQIAPGSLRSDVPVLLGDIVLAYETVRREAAEQDKSLTNHLRHLVVHGVLHLLGFRSEEHTSELQSHLNLVCR